MINAVTSPYKPAQSLCNLPVFKPVRERISRAFLSAPDCVKLADLVALDPAILAELLSAANAPFYGHAGQIYIASEAIRILGWDETERIANLVFDAQAKFSPELQVLVRAHWAHSLVCATIAYQVSQYLGVPAERAFAFAMLHDIGAWGLMGSSPDAYRQVFGQGSRTCVEKLGAEECMMGIDHCKVGSWLVKSWGLPAEFAEATGLHHETELVQSGGAATVIAVACRWADALGFSTGHMEKITIRDAIRIAPPGVIPILKSMASEISQKCRVKLLEYASGFDSETAKLFSKL